MTEANFLPTADRERPEGRTTDRQGKGMMFLVQIAMTILIIGRPVGLSCFSCGILSARRGE